jgi:deoxycytidylate deaminase|tara:strand:- start:918 stop:1280 length:363 start_codon:yes stop_codon:yes gene_type:complete
VYYRAKSLAINNGRTYHVAAILKRKGKVVRIGENTDKTHPRFKRQYDDGTWASHMHAEMNVLRFAKPGDELEVIRFRKCNHQRTMAKPCNLCMRHLKDSGIKKVKYTNWDGEWETLIIQT